MNKEDEKVLVVPSSIIFGKESWQGLKRDNLDYYLDLIKNNYSFIRRGDIEEDSSYQQIIPYIIFSFGNKFFLYKYIKGAGEQRLVNNYQLGVGGHINEIDKTENIIEAGAMREWEEEVFFKGNILNKKLVGILNDESRPVEKVHLGMIYHFMGDSSEIFVRETDKMEGELKDLAEIGEAINGIQGWPPVIWRDYLSKIKLFN